MGRTRLIKARGEIVGGLEGDNRVGEHVIRGGASVRFGVEMNTGEILRVLLNLFSAWRPFMFI